MIYHHFQDLKLSSLGMGCMRLPTLEGKDSEIDEVRTAEMVEIAMNAGINYFDTAWFYHGGNSESVMGKVLEKYPRDSFYLATKFPGFRPTEPKDPSIIFEKQLEKCRTDYFDFYLFHNVCERNVDQFTDESIGIHRYLMEQKKAGRIRHLGFSTHGSLNCIKRFLDTYGKDLEFCQIQLNWLDWKLQNAKAKVELLQSYGIPVWVMEPVRGGRLINLPAEDLSILEDLRPGVTTPEWAFRFLQTIPTVTMVLSGMSNETQLRENIATHGVHAPLNDHEFEVLQEMADRMIARNAVPCTACSYCVKECPKNLPIPQIISLYNERTQPNAEKPGNPGPSDCIGCGKCKSMCPQNINIPDIMMDYNRYLD